MPKPLHLFLADIIRPASCAWHAILVNQWPTIMGMFASRALPIRIDQSTLTIGVSDSCLLQELYLLKPLIMQKINLTLGQSYIQKIHLKLANIRRKPITTAPIRKNTQRIALSTQEQAALSTITDPDLQKALICFKSRCNTGR